MSVAMGLDTFNRRKAVVVGAISVGVALASYGELKFVFSGFIFQCLGIVFEATRLVAIQKLLQGMRMDPVSPLVCARNESSAHKAAISFEFDVARVPVLLRSRMSLFHLYQLSCQMVHMLRSFD